MNSTDYLFTTEGHISDEGVAVWLEHLEVGKLNDLPQSLFEHIEQCGACKERLVEAGLVYFPSPDHTSVQLPDIPVFTSRSYPIWIKIAAFLVILLVIGTVVFRLMSHQKNEPQTLFAHYFKPYPDFISVKSSSVPDPEKTLFHLGLNLYNKTNYDSALLVFNYLSIQFPANDTIAFFRGNATLASGTSPDTAILIFRDLVEKNSVFLKPAQWYLALAYLANNQTNNAIPLLRNLTIASDHYREKAEEVLKTLHE